MMVPVFPGCHCLMCNWLQFTVITSTSDAQALANSSWETCFYGSTLPAWQEDLFGDRALRSVTPFCWAFGSRRSHAAITHNPTWATPLTPGWTGTSDTASKVTDREIWCREPFTRLAF